MRKEFVKNRALSSNVDFAAAMDIDGVLELCPWASVIIEVYGGWRAFESLDDFEVWSRQD